MSRDNHSFRMIYLALNQIYNRHIKKTYPAMNKLFIIQSKLYKKGIIKGRSIHKESEVPKSARLEWEFYVSEDNSYIVISLIDHIFYLIPYVYHEYVYEVPKNKYNIQSIDNDTILDILSALSRYKWNKDLYLDKEYTDIAISRISNMKFLKFSEENYKFIKTR